MVEKSSSGAGFKVVCRFLEGLEAEEISSVVLLGFAGFVGFEVAFDALDVV